MKTIQTLVCIITLFLVLSVKGFNAAASPTDSTQNLTFSFNADLVSRYVWRGLSMNLNPNIQPYASITYKNFSFGAWGSYGLSEPYAEIDLNLSYTVGPISLAVYDYFNEDELDMASNNYFKFSNSDSSNTPHALEGSISFNGTDNIPLTFTVATFFYGNDKNEEGKNYYSTYMELGYAKDLGENSLTFFLGGTIADGFYAKKAAFVNLGFSASREIKFSEKVSIPVSSSLIINPEAKDIFFVFGMTF